MPELEVRVLEPLCLGELRHAAHVPVPWEVGLVQHRHIMSAKTYCQFFYRNLFNFSITELYVRKDWNLNHQQV